MRHLNAGAAGEAASGSPRSDGPGNAPPRHAANPWTKIGRLSFMLGVYAALGTVGVPLAASAAARHPAHAGHGKAALATASGHGARPGHGSRAHSASHAAHAAAHWRTRFAGAGRPAHGGRFAKLGHASPVRSAGAVHRDVVPLANTTWDNPTMPPAVLDAIQTAARASGVDPHLLVALAWRESRFNPDARNNQSSAKGLLQFTSGTWLRAVRDYGSEHDVANYAAAIRTSRSGDIVVPDRMRSAILRLRNNPALSANLAADSMQRGRVAMEARLGRRVTSTDLYLMHVLGPTGAMRFLTALAQQPEESSLKVASFKVMRNAGLLAQDGRPLTVASTYAAAGTMLDSQHVHSAPLLATAQGGDALASAPPQMGP